MSDPTPMTRPERDFYQRLGDRIRAARQRHSLSQTTFGRRLGVTGTAISYWENAIHAPTLWHVREIERVLGEQIHEH